jgi:hypothetical protein
MPTSDNNRSRAADPKLGEKHPHDFTMKPNLYLAYKRSNFAFLFQNASY